ncbi:MAG: ribosome silencing factor [Chloroflexota bacterium]
MPFTKEVILDTKDITRVIVDAAAEKKASNILLLEVRELTTLADYFVICEGTSKRQLGAIRDGIQDTLKEEAYGLRHREGTPDSGWILLDYENVLVHIFSPERRAYYQLESLWEDAPTIVKML